MRSKPLALIAAIAVGCASPRQETPKSVMPGVSRITECEPVVIHLVHADAVELSLMLGEILDASKRQFCCCTLCKPELVNRIVRTNSLILRDFEPDDLQTMRKLIARLDVEP